MESDKKYLLSTRPLPKAIIEEGIRRNVIIEELSFIATSPIQNSELFQKIKTLSKENRTVVFTSMNAVEAVAAQVDNVAGWKVYCIGNTTRQLVKEKLPSAAIAATGENAQHLAERLVDDGVRKAVFFCGDIRRDELPNKIRSEGGEVEEVVVYETEEKPSLLTKEYDGILFFSPSAVGSFFKVNKVAKHTKLFAIGKTTEETLRQFANRKIIVGTTPGKQQLAMQAIEYLSSQTTGDSYK